MTNNSQATRLWASGVFVLVGCVTLVSLAVQFTKPASAAVKPESRAEFKRSIRHQISLWFRPRTSAHERAVVREEAGVVAIDGGKPEPELQLVESRVGVNPSRALHDLQRNPHVRVAERNKVVETGATRPTDPEFPNQWALENTGQLMHPVADPHSIVMLDDESYPLTPGVDLSMPMAWDITQGSPRVVVAVLDTGGDPTHPDANNWKQPDASIHANGPLDGQFGADFAGHTDEPIDDNGHGTAVAGIISAKADNGIGGVGVSWHSPTMAVRIGGQNGEGSVYDVAKGVEYAAAKGVSIVNMSSSYGQSSKVLLDAFMAHPNVLFVAIPGNESLDIDAPGNDRYPCSYDLPNILCVAAVDGKGNIAGFSSYGNVTVDVAAPGEAIFALETRWVSTQVFGEDFNAPIADNEHWISDPGWSQTSEAARGGAGSSMKATGPGYLSTTKPLNLAAAGRCELSYFTQGVHPVVEISTDDGAHYQEMKPTLFIASGEFVVGSEVLPSADNVRFRFKRQLAPPNSRAETDVFVDDIAVNCSKAVRDPSTSYTFSSGTSEAAPQVSGLAALLKSIRPQATMDQLKAAIRNRVDRKPDLSNQVATGGRVNALKSLQWLEKRLPVAPGDG